MAVTARTVHQDRLERTLERRRGLYARQMRDRVLACFRVVGLPATSHLSYVPDIHRMCDAQIEQLEARRALDDDSLPVLQTHMGMGIFGALFGSEVIWRPEEQTSWSDPPFEGAWPADYAARLRFDPKHPIAALALRNVRHCTAQAGGRFGIGLLETIDGLNLVNELRGATNGFMDLYLNPEIVDEVMELGVQWNIDWLEMQMAETGPFAGGWVSLGGWFPSPTVWLSVDAYGACKLETYVEKGREYMQRLIDHFGHGFQHLHADGMRLLPEIMKLRNLVGIQIGEDVGYPRPFDVIREIQATAGDMPLQIGCSWGEFEQGLVCGTLAGGVEYHVGGAPSVAEASRLAAEARVYSDRHRLAAA